jgi:chromosome segregation ATPase
VNDLTKRLQDQAKVSPGSDEKEVATLKTTVIKLKKEVENTKKASEKSLENTRKEIASLTSQLKKTQDELRKSKNDVVALKVQLKQAKSELKKALSADSSAKSTRSNGSAALQNKIKTLKKELKEMTDSNQKLIERNTTLNNKLQDAYNQLKKQGKTSKSEQNAQVLKAAKEYLREIVFRTTKLVHSKNKEEVQKFTKKIYDGIKEDLGLEDEHSDDFLEYDDFHRIYQSSMLAYFSAQRCNVQQNCLKAIQGAYFTQCFV